MLALKIIFWISLLILIYSYIGYGIFLWLYLKVKKTLSKPVPPVPLHFEPAVTLVIASYNEASIIREKINNTLALDYPADKFKIIFVTDGSTDNTPDIVKEYGDRIQLFHSNERRGKVAAINRTMQFVTTPVVIFCDANTALNTAAVKEIVKHFKDEKVGAVAGEKKVIDPSEASNAAGSGEGLYWKYESVLKKLDAEFYTVVGAAGELFSVRTHLFEHSGDNILLDDFIISMNICKKGYRVMYEPNAFAMEAPSATMKDEQKRKVRIGAGAFQSMHMLSDLLNIFKYGKLSFQYISHRVLRWSICPVLLPVMLIVNILLVVLYPNIHGIYSGLLWCQGIFYVAAITGLIFAQKNIKIKLFYVPYYFLFMNMSLIAGFFRYINNQQTVLWEKAVRKA